MPVCVYVLVKRFDDIRMTENTEMIEASYREKEKYPKDPVRWERQWFSVTAGHEEGRFQLTLGGEVPQPSA